MGWKGKKLAASIDSLNNFISCERTLVQMVQSYTGGLITDFVQKIYSNNLKFFLMTYCIQSKSIMKTILKIITCMACSRFLRGQTSWREAVKKGHGKSEDRDEKASETCKEGANRLVTPGGTAFLRPLLRLLSTQLVAYPRTPICKHPCVRTHCT